MNRDVAVEAGLNYAPDDIWGKIRPQEDINDEALACGRRAFASAGKTETADIQAGSEVGFHISQQVKGHSVSLRLIHTENSLATNKLSFS